MKRLFVIIIILLDACSISNRKANYFKPEFVKYFPQPIGYVNDFENDFTVGQIETLDSIIKQYKVQSTNEISLVTIKTIEPYDSIWHFAKDLSNYWGVGDKSKDNGLIIVFSKELKEIRLSTGLGTEKILTDVICQGIIDSFMIPHFKESNYFEGVQSGLNECIRRWK